MTPPPGAAADSLNKKLGDLLKEDHRRLLPRVQDLLLLRGGP